MGEKSLQYFELYRSFHEDINKRKIAEVNAELSTERKEKELVEAEKNRQEIEALKKQLELYSEIQSQDSLNQSLFGKLTKREMEMELLEKTKELAEIRANEEARQNEKLQTRQNYLTIII